MLARQHHFHLLFLPLPEMPRRSSSYAWPPLTLAPLLFFCFLPPFRPLHTRCFFSFCANILHEKKRFFFLFLRNTMWTRSLSLEDKPTFPPNFSVLSKLQWKFVCVTADVLIETIFAFSHHLFITHPVFKGPFSPLHAGEGSLLAACVSASARAMCACNLQLLSVLSVYGCTRCGAQRSKRMCGWSDTMQTHTRENEENTSCTVCLVSVCHET